MKTKCSSIYIKIYSQKLFIQFWDILEVEFYISLLTTHKKKQVISSLSSKKFFQTQQGSTKSFTYDHERVSFETFFLLHKYLPNIVGEVKQIFMPFRNLRRNVYLCWPFLSPNFWSFIRHDREERKEKGKAKNITL